MPTRRTLHVQQRKVYYQKHRKSFTSNSVHFLSVPYDPCFALGSCLEYLLDWSCTLNLLCLPLPLMSHSLFIVNLQLLKLTSDQVFCSCLSVLPRSDLEMVALLVSKVSKGIFRFHIFFWPWSDMILLQLCRETRLNQCYMRKVPVLEPPLVTYSELFGKAHSALLLIKPRVHWRYRRVNRLLVLPKLSLA